MGFTLARYVGLSVLAASAVVYHAFATRQHFYRAAMYLSSSKIAVAAMGNMAFALALSTHQLVIKLFLGSLRDIEQEMIRERLSSAVMESLLALTIFREEFSTFFVAMFASLVFIKVMHWLVQDRVDYVEVTPNISLLGHLRIVSFMALLLALDAAFLQYTIAGTIQSSGQSVMLLFAFEYVILASTIVRYALKYGMSMVDLAMDGNWTGKGTAVFYLELIADLLHLFVYVTFFTIVFMHYGLPLHLVRDLYSTFRNFRSRMHDFLRFRQVTARLDRFPDASADDLRRLDGVCIICREEMTEAGSNKKLFCGHVFHLHCLRSWLERQQNCPTCRASVFRRPASGQQQEQVGAEPAAAAIADGANAAAHRAPAHAAAADGAADAAVVRPPVESHAAAAAAAGSLRHRRPAGANAANADTGAAATPHADSDASSSVAVSRASSQPPAVSEATAATGATIAARGASSLAPATAGAAGASGSGAALSAAVSASGATSAAAGGGTGGAGPSGAGPFEAMLQTTLEALRAEQQRLVQRLAAKRQQAQQRGISVTRLLLTDPSAAAAVSELAQVRSRIQQLEAVEEAAGTPATVLPPHLTHMFMPVVAPNGVAGGAAAAAASPYSLIPFAATAFQAPFQAPASFGVPPVVMAPVPLMPVVPVALSTGAGFGAAAAASVACPAVAGVQVPLHHHQLAAAAAAAAASAAAAAMFGAGMVPNGGGMFFMPLQQQPQPQQAAAAAAAGAPAQAVANVSTAAGTSADGASKAAEAAPMAGPVEEMSTPAAPTEPEAAGPSGSESRAAVPSPEAAPAVAAAGVGATAQRAKETAGEASQAGAPPAAAEPDSKAHVPAAAAPGEAAPAAFAPAAASEAAAEEAGGARAEEDPQEAIRRIRLQRFGQQS